MDNAEQSVGSAESTQESTLPTKPVKLTRVSMAATLAICSGAWLVPGLGHILLGRWVRGLIFTACVASMFMLGIAMQGKLYDLAIQEPLQVFAFIANVGAGGPYILAEMWEKGIGTMTSTTYDYGTTFLWVSGLLNYLIVLDTFDIAQGRKP